MNVKLGTGMLMACFSVNAMAVDFSTNGDIRIGYYSLDRDTRSGNDDKTDEFRLRARGCDSEIE